MIKRNKRKLRVKNLALTTNEIKEISPKTILIDSVIFDEKFDILVEKNQKIDKFDVIMINKSGQKILSPFNARCTNISLVEDERRNLSFCVELENLEFGNVQNNIKTSNFSGTSNVSNATNISTTTNKSTASDKSTTTNKLTANNKSTTTNISTTTNKSTTSDILNIDDISSKMLNESDEGGNYRDLQKNENANVNGGEQNVEQTENLCEKINKSDLIELCKNSGVIFENFFIEDFFGSLGENLLLNFYDDSFVYNNSTLVCSYFEEIKKAIEILNHICAFKHIFVYYNKKNCKDYSLFNEKLDFENMNFIDNMQENRKENMQENMQKNTQKSVKKRENFVKFISKKPPKMSLSSFDLLKIYWAIIKKNVSFSVVTFSGGALCENRVILVPFGTKICDVIENFGGLKQNIDEIEDYKYMSMVALNDLEQLKKKIKQAKNKEDKEKLIKMLNQKSEEAQKNIFSKFEDYQKKFYDCLSACIILGENKKGKKTKFATKNLNLPINPSYFGVHLLSFKEFH